MHSTSEIKKKYFTFKRQKIKVMGKTCVLIFVIPLIVVACSNSVSIDFKELKNNIVQFNITNSTSKDILDLSIETTYILQNNEIVLDTINYRMRNENDNTLKSFLKAGEQTFIVHKTPDNCSSAKARILNVNYINN